ncbi:MAG: translocation/assembly module TamB domain-containing protein [Dysgonomonas sp.]
MVEAEEIKNVEEKPKKKSFVKKILKVLLYIVLCIIGLNILLYTLFSIPYVQQKAANFAVGELKKTLNTEVSIDELRLSLFNRVSLKGIYIEDQATDTLLYAKELSVRLSPWEFIKSSKLAITAVNLDNFLINVNQKDSTSDMNFQFIIDAFSSNDATKADTTKNSLAIIVTGIELKNGRLNYDVLSDTLTPGLFNASHISLYDFTANLDLNSIDPDKFDIAINSLSAKEKSGLEVKSLKGSLYSDKSQLWVDGLSMDLPESHLIMDKTRYNLSTGEFELITNDIEISPHDLVAFLPNMKFLTNNIKINARMRGALPAVNIDTISLVYGEDFYLRGKAELSSYAQYGDADINLTIEKLKATPSAITSFARLGDSAFVAPDILKDLGDVYLKGELNGRLSKFKLDAEAWSRHGALNLLATGNIDTTFTNFNVTAGLQTKNFNLGRLLGNNSGLGRLTAHLNLKARQTSKEPLNARIQGKLDALDINKETMKNLPFDAYYNAKEMGVSAKADWRIGKVYVEASMSQAKVPDIHMQLKVDTLHVDHFYKNEDWINPRLSLALNGDIKGLDIDNMTGLVYIDSLDFYDANFNFSPGKFSLEAGKKDKNDKYINLNSSLLTANISGRYAFMSLADEFSELMNNYLPEVFHQKKRLRSSRRKNLNDFTFKVTANNTEQLGKILALPVDIIKPASISGHISTIDKVVNIDGDIPHLRFGAYDIENTTISVANADSAFNAIAGSKVLMEKGDYDLSLYIDGAENSIHALLRLFSSDTDININGQVEAHAEFTRNEKKELVSSLKIFPSDIAVGKLALNILPAEIINAGTRTEIQNFGIGVNKKRYFGAEGVISESESDSLRAYFDHAEVGVLLEAFDIKNIRGCIHGDVILTNLLKQPELYTNDFEIADIVMFSDTLGTMALESEWSDEFGGARLNATLERLDRAYGEIDGTVYTNQDSLDLQLRLDQMPLDWTQPFLTGMLNKISGTVSTNLMIEGSTKAPKLRGFLGFNGTQLGIDYTNVLYTISDTISVSPDRIGFDSLMIRDNQGNTARVNATLTHKNFQDMKYSLNMRMNKLMVLNTEHRTDSLFYGKVFASGTVNVNGDDNGINMKMQIKNDKNSNLNILLPQHSEASDYKSVVYINVPEEKLKEAMQNVIKSSVDESLPINLNIALEVTPDVVLGIVLDPVTGDEMQARGSGTINFSYNMQTQNMAAYGDYTLRDGYVKLNLKNLKKLQFAIQNGSKLYFSGDPLKTRFDITAYRRVRTELKTLDASFASDNYPSKIDVDCILGIKGDINKMTVTYNISLPEGNDDVRARVNSYISTDEQKTLQFAALVATGSFYSSGGTSGSNLGNSLWTSLASSTLSTGLTALVGSVLGDQWQIGANVESNDGTFSDMNMSVNVSRKFLDDRLQVKTNVGYRNDQTTADNALIGDFDVEYMLNSMWTLKAYSHTNDRYYRQAPTTQGIGIVYSKEAATLKRLFQSFKPRRRVRPAQQQETPALPSDSTQNTVVKQPIINNEKKE